MPSAMQQARLQLQPSAAQQLCSDTDAGASLQPSKRRRVSARTAASAAAHKAGGRPSPPGQLQPAASVDPAAGGSDEEPCAPKPAARTRQHKAQRAARVGAAPSEPLSQRLHRAHLTSREAAALDALPLPPQLERLAGLFAVLNGYWTMLQHNRVQAKWSNVHAHLVGFYEVSCE